MSTISIPYIGTLKGIDKAKTEIKEKKSSKHDCYVILGLSCILLDIVWVAMMLGPVRVRIKSRIVDKRYLVLNKEDFILVRNSSRLRYPTAIMVKA
ncbi:MAG: hypothetical protein ACR2IS_09610 [Nitrososphaeraceae archaeon]